MRIARALAITCVLLAGAFGAGEAAAHPLGNFSVNHLTEVEVSRDRVEALYVLDQAEIPTFQERGLSPPRCWRASAPRSSEGCGWRSTGARCRCAPAGAAAHRLPRRPGRAEDDAGGDPARRARRRPAARGAARRDLRRAGRGGRRSWRSPATGTAVRSTAPSGDPTNGLRAYPEDALSSPLDQRRRDVRGARPAAERCAAPASPGRRRRRTTSRGRRRLHRACSATPPRARECCCCCCWRRSAGERCTRCRPVTARRWWPPT